MSDHEFSPTERLLLLQAAAMLRLVMEARNLDHVEVAVRRDDTISAWGGPYSGCDTVGFDTVVGWGL